MQWSAPNGNLPVSRILIDIDTSTPFSRASLTISLFPIQTIIKLMLERNAEINEDCNPMFTPCFQHQMTERSPHKQSTRF